MRAQCQPTGAFDHAPTRKRHSADFKARVALEAVRRLKTSAQLTSEFQVHPAQISQWKRNALEHLPEVFGRDASREQRAEEELTAALFEEIGRLKMELDWRKRGSSRKRWERSVSEAVRRVVGRSETPR